MVYYAHLSLVVVAINVTWLKLSVRRLSKNILSSISLTVSPWLPSNIWPKAFGFVQYVLFTEHGWLSFCHVP